MPSTQMSCTTKQPLNLKEIGRHLISIAESPGITLIEKHSKNTSSDIRRLFPEGPVIVCDFPLSDIVDESSSIAGCPRIEEILNIDHHLPFESMERFISSGNLAAQYLRSQNKPAKSTPILVNHTDCDSTISSLMMRGHIPPADIFESAVIAADHTGAQNPIADLLQALDPLADLSKSIRNLGLLLSEQALDPECQKLVEQRALNRIRAKEILDQKRFKIIDNLAVVEIDGERIGGELFLPHFSQNSVLVTFRNRPEDGRQEARLRLCAGAPEGFSLHKIDMESVDPGYGGRWNAGSNRRSLGSNIPQDQYLQKLSAALATALHKFKASAA